MLRPSVTPRPLSAATLAHHAARVEVPRYDRAALRPAVVHLSVGVFHRSHQAVYFDELAQRGVSMDWGLVGVGLRSDRLRDVLTEQDGLYTVVERAAHHDTARVVGVLRDYLFAPDDPGAVLAALASPRTQLVTLTVTGDGYVPGRGTVWEHLAQAFAWRRRRGLSGVTVLSCDNLLRNGALARGALLATAEDVDPRLAAWIAEHVAFPSSMVDRITPRTTPSDRTWIARTFGVRDRWPVITEPFSQWVVEDSFAAERPPLEAVGVRLVPDVAPYALAKTRLLNAAHVAVGLLGSLAGLRRLDEAVADPVLGTYVRALMEEVEPLLPPVHGLDLAAYRAELLERFANPKIGDQLARLRRRGSGKVPAHLLSSIREARAERRPHPCLTMAVAGWLRALRGTDEAGRLLTLDDPLAARLQRLALAGGTDPRPVLGERDLFGDLADDEELAVEVAAALRALDAHGVHAALHMLLHTDQPLAA